MPCGSRPSMAALMRSGARNASEIVILTLRTLHHGFNVAADDVSVPSGPTERPPISGS